MLLPYGLNTQEIRVLQEYRRLTSETLTLEQIRAVKHPAGGGEPPAWSLVEKGFLAADEEKQNLTLTDRGREFLAIDALPGKETSNPSLEG